MGRGRISLVLTSDMVTWGVYLTLHIGCPLGLNNGVMRLLRNPLSHIYTHNVVLHTPYLCYLYYIQRMVCLQVSDGCWAVEVMVLEVRTCTVTE